MLGIVIRTGRVHRIDISAARSAILPELAFQGATKRNKPPIQVIPDKLVMSDVSLRDSCVCCPCRWGRLSTLEW